MKHLSLLSLCLVLAGCAGSYQLGTTLPPDLRDVYVPAIVNESTEPTLHQVATQKLLREIQRDGTLNLVSDETSATTVLEVIVRDVDMDIVTYQTNDKHTGREYRATVRSHVVFRKRATGTVLYEGNPIGEEEFDVGGDLNSAKRRMMPKACEDLAKNIVNECISIW